MRSTQQNVHRCMETIESWDRQSNLFELSGGCFRSLDQELRHAAGWSREESARLLAQLNARNHGYIAYLTPGARGVPLWNQCGVTLAGFKRMLMMSDTLPETFWLWLLRPTAEIVRVVEQKTEEDDTPVFGVRACALRARATEEPDPARPANNDLKVFKVITRTVGRGYLEYTEMAAFSKGMFELGMTDHYLTGDEFKDEESKEYGIRMIQAETWTRATLD